MATVASVVTTAGLGATVVHAQQADGGPTVRQEATSEMQGDTVRVEVSETVVVPPAQQQSTSTAGSGGSGGGAGGGGSGWGDATDQGGFEFSPASALSPEPVLACFDEVTSAAGAVLVPLGGCPGEPGDDPEGGSALVDPLVLALRAFSEMDLPAPVPGTSPSLEEGTFAQLATFFFLDDWEPMSNSASAGAVTATATAEPLTQTWTINDAYAGTSEAVTCEGPGAPFDPSRAYEAQVPPECGWTPRHSSAGQTSTGGARREPCFPTTVTLSWDVTWTSNIGAGGDLGMAATSTEVCLVVAELQALVTQHGR